MASPTQPPADEPQPDAAQDLGRSYADMLGQQTWEVDVAAAPEADTPAAAADSAPEVPPQPVRIIEALLFVGGPPLTAVRAGEAIRGLTPTQFSQAIDALNQEYRQQGRPYLIQPQGQGYVLTLRPRYRPVVERLYGSTREARLSPQAIDVLSLVAYRQPATRQEIDSLRGVESGALLRQLVRRNLITVVHRGEADQREVAYGTTARFLKLFNLGSLDDLPRTQDLQIL
jgi:segregation and condensation protein B